MREVGKAKILVSSKFLKIFDVVEYEDFAEIFVESPRGLFSCKINHKQKVSYVLTEEAGRPVLIPMDQPAVIVCEKANLL